MTYRLLYGDASAMTGRERHLDERVQSEDFSTEYEALYRARELIDGDETHTVAIYDHDGNELAGIRLHLKLGCCEA